MDSFVDRMERMRVNAQSPDGTVRASYTVRDGIQLTLDSNRLSRHSEESLAQAAGAAVRGVFSGYDKGSGQVLRSGGNTRKPPRKDSEPARMRAAYERGLDDIDVVAVSPRRCVKARFRGNAPPEVRIQPGTLGRMDISTDQMEAELNAVITQASHDFGQQRSRLRREIFDERKMDSGRL